MQRKRCDHVLADKDTEGRVGQVTDVHLHRQPHIHQHVPCAGLQQPLVFLRHACSALLVIPSHSLCFSITETKPGFQPDPHSTYSHKYTLPPPPPPPFFILFLLLVQYEDIIAGLKGFFRGFSFKNKTNFIVPCRKNLGHHTWVMHSSCKSSATHSYQGMQYFGVSQQTYGCQCLGCLTGTKMLMLVIAGHMTGFLTDIKLWQPKGRKWVMKNS